MDNSFKVNRGLNLLPQSTTPTNPSNGDIYYDNTLNKFRKYENGLWSDLGSGGSGSGKNYLGTVNGINGNGDFEIGSTSKWSLFNTTLTSLIPTGTVTAGAASITTFDTVSAAQLAGTYSLRTASSAAWAAGQGFISDAFTFENEDLGQPMDFSITFKIFSGASNANYSGSSSNTFAAYLYDVTNATWVQPVGVYSMINNGTGKIQGTVQPTANAAQYRLAILAINASAGAISIYWDSAKFGPSSGTTAVPSPLQPLTQTRLVTGSSLTYTTPAGVKWIRIRAYGGGAGGSGGGGSAGNGTVGNQTSFGPVSCPGGSPTGQGGIPTPSSVGVINSPAFGVAGYGSAAGGIQGSPAGQGAQGGHGGNTPLMGGGGGSWAAGTGSAGSPNSGGGGGGGGAGANSVSGCGGGAGAWVDAVIINPLASYTYTVGTGGTGGAAGTGGGVGGAGAAGQIIIDEFYTAYGTDAGQIIAARYTGAPATIISGSLAVGNALLSFGTKSFDTTGAYSTATGLFVAPASGFYQVNLSVSITGTSTGGYIVIHILKNGTNLDQFYLIPAGGNSQTASPAVQGASMMFLNAGDTLSITGESNFTSPTLQASAPTNFLTIHRINSASGQTSNSQTVSAGYSSVAGNSIPNAANTLIDFATKEWDSHNAVLGAGAGNKPIASTGTTWRYIVPVSGIYVLECSIHIGVVSATASVFLIDVNINGTLYKDGLILTGYVPGASDALGSVNTCQLRVKAGDMIELSVFQSNGTRNMQAIAARNHITITRIGSYV